VGALDGLRVVEAGLLIQGPQAAATLQAWGADVVKVELPGIGDQARWLPAGPADFRSPFFIACNRGKRSLAIDLRTDGGREAFLRLAAASDVVISNFTPGTMEGWGLGYDAVAAANPGVVYAVGSTFGSLGPDAPKPGADLAGQAAGGLVSGAGRGDGEPTPVAAAIADHIAAQNLVGGILAALLARGRTGRGQLVETSLLGGQVWAQATELTARLLTGAPIGRADRGHPLVPGLYGIFPTADGWIAVVGVAGGPDRTRFFEVLGRPDLGEQFSQLLYWAEDKAALFPLLDEVFRTRTTAEWCAALEAADLRCAPVRDQDQVVTDPGVWANGYLAEVALPDGSPTTVVNPPVTFSDTPARVEARPPELGEHTEEVLLELGYTWDDIGELREGGAI
jgi:crotonobetainyl-CoA:carnitine CoA-transferase CaiB-like acyl-CoA transferase